MRKDYCGNCWLHGLEDHCEPRKPTEQTPEEPVTPYFCPAPRHGWMAKPCKCLEAIKDPGVADRSLKPEVPAPDEVWVCVGQPFYNDSTLAGVPAPDEVWVCVEAGTCEGATTRQTQVESWKRAGYDVVRYVRADKAEWRNSEDAIVRAFSGLTVEWATPAEREVIVRHIVAMARAIRADKVGR